MMATDYAAGALHYCSQLLQIPTIVALLALGAFMLFCIGWIIVEYFTERRYFKVNGRSVIAAIRSSDYSRIVHIIAAAPIPSRLAAALLNVAGNMGLPDEELFALSQMEIARADARYQRRLHLTETTAKISPMLGLMGTLIPLGPGLMALGQGDVNTLSQSLLIAFDTTVMGLVSAIISLIVSRIRRTWYGQYASAMQSLMACILEEASHARDEGVALQFGYCGNTDLDLEDLRAEVSPEETQSFTLGYCDSSKPVVAGDAFGEGCDGGFAGCDGGNRGDGRR